MLDKVRRWRQKAYEADRAKPSAARIQEAEELARRLNLPLAESRSADVKE